MAYYLPTFPAILALTALVAAVLWSTPACAILFTSVGDGTS